MSGGKFVLAAPAILAAGLLLAGGSMSSAFAADLGGDCCADLEERVAELEATTARKGNRVMSVTLAGRVNQALFWWDNDLDQDVVVADNSAKGSRFEIKGSGKLRENVKVGFTLQIKARPNRSKKVDDWAVAKADDTYSGNDELAMGDVYWFVDHEQLGKLSVGYLAHAANGAAEVDLSSGINGIANMAASDENITFDGSLQAVKVFGFVNSDVGYLVKWDSPTFAGFQASASWGDDDRWSMAARYANEFDGVKIAAAVGYDVLDGTSEAANGPKVGVMASASIHHSLSGLFVSGSYGTRENDVEDLGTHWWVKGGFKKQVTEFGPTNIYAEYGEAEEFVDTATAANERNGSMWGAGIEQTFDDVSSTAYFAYRNQRAENSATGAEIGEIDTFVGGMIVNF